MGQLAATAWHFVVWGLGSMLNIYEPVAESGFGHLGMRSGNRGARTKKDCATPSTSEQVLFLVESAYDIDGEVAIIPDNNLMPCKFKGH
jgi:hypothetical protein